MKKYTLLLILLSLSGMAYGHQRDFISNYGYETLKEQKIESELFIDYAHDQGTTQFIESKLNLLYGINDRWEMGLEGSMRQIPSQPYNYNETKLSTQYRLAGRAEWCADPAIQFNYFQPSNANLKGRMEGILILEKKLAGWAWVGNLKFVDYTFTNNANWRVGASLGAAKEITPNLKFGLEWKADRIGVPDEQEQYIVPGAYIKIQDNMYWNIGLGIALNPKAYDYTAMSLLHYEF